jgi:hypothetical protein
MTSNLAVVQQSVDELSSDLGQMRRDATNLQTTGEALFDKISEPPAGRRAIPQAHTASIPAPTAVR